LLVVANGVRQSFEQLSGHQAIEFLSDPTSGSLGIGGASPFIDAMIPAVIARLAQRYPSIEFRVVESDTPKLCAQLRARALDLVIGRISTGSGEDDLVSDVLFEDRMCVVAGADRRWSRRREVKLAALVDEPWVMPEPDNLIWPLIEEAFRAAGVPPPVPKVMSSAMAIRLRLMETGGFLTVLPRSMLHFGAQRFRTKVLPVLPTAQPQAAQVIMLRNRTPNPIAKVFIDELRAFTGPLASRRI
jgi:DNA-binding transcriptional LysR family regulator